jgi:predicted glycosyltransferase
MMKDGHTLKILARDYGSTLMLLDKYGLKYEVYIKPSKNLRRLGTFQIFPYVFNEYRLARRFHPDLVVGIGPDEPLFAFFLHKPCLLFNDSEPMPLQHFINKTFARAIITPDCFAKDLGKKQIRFSGYKELAYLHPEYFKPDPAILLELHVSRNEKYVILRFNIFDAVHDIGKYGFSVSDQIKLVEELEKYARVFISPERALPVQLERYILPISSEKIHHALYYSQLLVTDTQTMATEAAILGTPVVRCNNFVGPHDMGNFVELEKKYELIYSFQNSEQAIRRAVELIKQPDLKKEWEIKRQRLLKEKIDVTRFMVDFIENYPASLAKFRKK